MSEEYRATPEQWANLAGSAEPIELHPGVFIGTKDTTLSTCILELRARVEELEKALRVATGSLDPAEQAALGVVPVADAQAAMHSAAAEAQDAAMSELRAASSLVERVQRAINHAPLHKEAPAAIREVAAAARVRDLNGQSVVVMTWEMVAQWLEQEANRG